MKYSSSVVLALSLITTHSLCHAQEEVDQRPLDVQVVPAFPKLQWPNELTGREEGLSKDVRPLVVTGAGDGSGRLFVATQSGVVMELQNKPDVEEPQVFLDLRDRMHYRVPEENEEGFLGLAFHPKFKENGELFIYYTDEYESDEGRKSVISRFRVSEDDPNRADPASEEVVMTIDQPFWNHNGGTIAFGPDGYLYVGLGDGGKRDDPFGNAQNLGTLLGSILRIDVDHQDGDRGYAIPKDNPFVDKAGARGEIWAYGIRNVWRIAFDRQTGDLWAGDVGQDVWEEIDLITKGGNYGWNLREAFHEFPPGADSPKKDMIDPMWEYHHDVGKSITGGTVYRGKAVPELKGAYLYADWVTGAVWALWGDVAANRATANRQIIDKGAPVMSFGEDDEGEVYFATQEGGLWKFASPKSQ